MFAESVDVVIGVDTHRDSHALVLLVAEVAPSPAERPRFYACGPTPLVEAVAEALVRLGHDPRAIKTERFGPTGG